MESLFSFLKLKMCQNPYITILLNDYKVCAKLKLITYQVQELCSKKPAGGL